MNRNIENKLFNFEAEPPAEIWDSISKALNKGATPTYQDKLYHFEQEPPVDAWEKIRSALGKEEAAPRSLLKKLNGSIKYAAAVLVLALISIAVYITRKAPGNIASQISKALQDKKHNKAFKKHHSTIQLPEKPDTDLGTIH